MPSPFPGMDPFLEDPKLWGGYHHQFVTSLYQLLLPGLVDRYRARVTARQYSSEVPLFTSVIREDHSEEYIEIRSRTDGRMVTVIDVVSPANKITQAGRAAYWDVRDHALSHRASVVEIDLLTQGKPTLDYSRVDLPEHDQIVTIARGGIPDRFEIESSTIQKRLPKFRLPLASDDREMLVDLQIVHSRAYDQGNFAKLIDYKSALPGDVKLSDTARNWVQQWLRLQKLR